MPYSMRMPDGTLVNDIPDDIQPYDAARQLAKAFPQFAPKPEEGIIPSLVGGFKRTVSTGRTGLESVFGSPEEAAKAGVERGEEISSQFAAGASLERVKEAYAKGGFGAAVSEVASQLPKALAEQAPNIAATLLSAKGGAMAGSVLGPGGALVGGITGAVAPSILGLFGANVERQAAEQMEAGKDVAIDRGAALAAAAPGAALEVASTFVPLGRTVVGKILGPKATAALSKGKKSDTALVEQSLKRTLAQGSVVGAGLEVPTEVIQQMLERAQAGLPLTSPDALAEYGEAAYGATLVGAPFGAAGRTLERGAQRQIVREREEEKAAAEAEAERIRAQQEAERELAEKAGAPLLGGEATQDLFVDEEGKIGEFSTIAGREEQLAAKGQLQREVQAEYDVLYRREVQAREEMEAAAEAGRTGRAKELAEEVDKLATLRSQIEARTKNKDDELFGIAIKDPELMDEADQEMVLQGEIDDAKNRLSKAKDPEKIRAIAEEVQTLTQQMADMRTQPDLFGTRNQARIDLEKKEAEEAEAEMKQAQDEAVTALTIAQLNTIAENKRTQRAERRAEQDTREQDILQEQALKRIQFLTDRAGLAALDIAPDEAIKIEAALDKGVITPDVAKKFDLFDEELAVFDRRIKEAKEKEDKIDDAKKRLSKAKDPEKKRLIAEEVQTLTQQMANMRTQDAIKAERAQFVAQISEPVRAVDMLDSIERAWEKATARQRELANAALEDDAQLFEEVEVKGSTPALTVRRGEPTQLAKDIVSNQILVDRLTKLRQMGRESRQTLEAQRLEETGEVTPFGRMARQTTSTMPDQILLRMRRGFENDLDAIDAQINFVENFEGPTRDPQARQNILTDLRIERSRTSAALLRVKKRLGPDVERATPIDASQAFNDFSTAIYLMQRGKFLGTRQGADVSEKVKQQEARRTEKINTRINKAEIELEKVNSILRNKQIKSTEERNQLLRKQSALEGTLRTLRAGLSEQGLRPNRATRRAISKVVAETEKARGRKLDTDELARVEKNVIDTLVTKLVSDAEAFRSKKKQPPLTDAEKQSIRDSVLLQPTEGESRFPTLLKQANTTASAYADAMLNSINGARAARGLPVLPAEAKQNFIELFNEFTSRAATAQRASEEGPSKVTVTFNVPTADGETKKVTQVVEVPGEVPEMNRPFAKIREALDVLRESLDNLSAQLRGDEPEVQPKFELRDYLEVLLGRKGRQPTRVKRGTSKSEKLADEIAELQKDLGVLGERDVRPEGRVVKVETPFGPFYRAENLDKPSPENIAWLKDKIARIKELQKSLAGAEDFEDLSSLFELLPQYEAMLEVETTRAERVKKAKERLEDLKSERDKVIADAAALRPPSEAVLQKQEIDKVVVTISNNQKRFQKLGEALFKAGQLIKSIVPANIKKLRAEIKELKQLVKTDKNPQLRTQKIKRLEDELATQEGYLKYLKQTFPIVQKEYKALSDVNKALAADLRKVGFETTQSDQGEYILNKMIEDVDVEEAPNNTRDLRGLEQTLRKERDAFEEELANLKSEKNAIARHRKFLLGKEKEAANKAFDSIKEKILKLEVKIAERDKNIASLIEQGTDTLALKKATRVAAQNEIATLRKEGRELNAQRKGLKGDERKKNISAYEAVKSRIAMLTKQVAKLTDEIKQYQETAGTKKVTRPEGKYTYAQILAAKNALMKRIDATQKRLAAMPKPDMNKFEKVLERARIGEIEGVGVVDPKTKVRVIGQSVTFDDVVLKQKRPETEVTAEKNAYAKQLENIRAEYAELKARYETAQKDPAVVAAKKAAEAAQKAVKTQKDLADGERLAKLAEAAIAKYQKVVDEKTTLSDAEAAKYKNAKTVAEAMQKMRGRMAGTTRLYNNVSDVKLVATKIATKTEIFVDPKETDRQASRHRFEVSLKKEKPKSSIAEAEEAIKEATALVNEAKKELREAEAKGNRALITAAKAKYLNMQKGLAANVAKLGELELESREIEAFSKGKNDPAADLLFDLNDDRTPELDDAIADYNKTKNTSWAVGEGATQVIDMDEASEYMDGVVEKAAKRGIKVKVIKDYATAKLSDLKYLSEQLALTGYDIYADKIRGGVYPDGTVVVIIGHHNTIAELEQTVAHEIVGHYTVDALLGKKGLNELLDKVETAFAPKEEPKVDLTRRRLVQAAGTALVTPKIPASVAKAFQASSGTLTVDSLSEAINSADAWLTGVVENTVATLGGRISLSDASALKDEKLWRAADEIIGDGAGNMLYAPEWADGTYLNDLFNDFVEANKNNPEVLQKIRRAYDVAAADIFTAISKDLKLPEGKAEQKQQVQEEKQAAKVLPIETSGLMALAKKLGVEAQAEETYQFGKASREQLVKDGAMTAEQAERFARIDTLREMIAITTERVVPKSIASTVNRFLQEIISVVRKVLVSMGLKSFGKMSTNDIYMLIYQANKAFESGKSIAYKTVGDRIVLSTGGAAKWAPTVSPSIQKTVSKVVAKKQTFMQKVLPNIMGMGFRMQFVDAIDALEKIKARVTDKGMLDAVKASNLTYFYRMYQQRMSFTAEAATNGVVQLTPKKRADGLIEYMLDRDLQKDAASLKKVTMHLSQAGFGDSKANGNFFTMYMAAERALAVGRDKLDYTNTLTDAELNEVRKVGRANKAIQAARKEYNNYNKDLITLAVQTGAISKELAQKLLSKGDYIPYYRQNAQGVVNLFIDSEKIMKIGSIADQPYLKELVGGQITDGPKSQPIEDFFESSLQNTSMIMDLALRNLATRNVVYTLNELGLAKRVSDKMTGGNVLRFRKDGKDEAWEISTEGSDVFGDIPAEMIVKGVDGIKTQVLAGFRLMAVPANYFRTFVTRDPRYAIRQVFRDSMAAYMATGSDAKPLINTMGELYSAVTKEGGSQGQRTLGARGITGGQVVTGDIADMAKIMQQLTSGKPGWHTAMAKLDAFAMAGDSATRVSAYNSFLKQGLSEREATLASLEMMNFSRRGLSPTMMHANMIIPFLSANVQGLDVLYRALKGQMPESERLKVQRKLAMRGTFMVAATLAYALAMDDDEAYEDANAMDRYSNWFVKIPGIDSPFKVPIPFELGFFFKAIPEGLVRAAKSEERGSEIIGDLAKMFARSIPGDIPLAVKPALEVMTDYSAFTGQRVVPARLASFEKEYQYTSKTPEAIKVLGQLISGKFGDTQIGLSPVQIEHLVRGYFGGVPIALLGMTDPVFRSLAGVNVEQPSMRLTDVPILGGLFQPVDAGGIVGRAYETARAADKVNRTYKDLQKRGDYAEAKKYREENLDLARLASVSGTFTQQVGMMEARIRKIRASETMSAEEKREKITKIEAQQKKAAQRLLDARDRRERRTDLYTTQ